MLQKMRKVLPNNDWTMNLTTQLLLLLYAQDLVVRHQGVDFDEYDVYEPRSFQDVDVVV